MTYQSAYIASRRLRYFAFSLVLLLLLAAGLSFGGLLSPEKLQRSLEYCQWVASGSYPQWRDARLIDRRAYCDLSGEPLVYVYSVQRGNLYLGYITVSARDEFFPLFEYSDGPRPSWKTKYCLEKVEEMGYRVGEVRYIFAPPMDYLVMVVPARASGRSWSDGLVLQLNSGIICPTPEVATVIDEYSTALVERADQVKSFWRKNVLSGVVRTKQGGDVLVARLNNPDAYNYTFIWYKGCGPTSITMLLAYYGGAWGFRNFWRDDPAYFPWCGSLSYTIQELHDKVVEFGQNLGDGTELGGPGYEGCEKLKYGMYSTTAQATIEAVADYYGYSFTTDYMWDMINSRQAMYTAVQKEINENHPVFLGIGTDTTGPWSTHAVLGVGYRYSGGEHQIIAHNTWDHSRHHHAMEGFQNWQIVLAAPLGFANTPPKLTEPSVNPLSGPPGTTFTFTVKYFDADEASFYVDGTPDFEPFRAEDDNGGNWTGGAAQTDYKGDPIAGNGVVDYEPWNETGDHCSDDTWYSDVENIPWPDPSGWWSSPYSPFNLKDGDTFIDLNMNGVWESERFDDANCNGMWDGDNGPFEGWVNVDGMNYPMRVVGTPAKLSDAYYEAKVQLGPGIHEYYFYFKDGNGGTARLPARGGTYKNIRVGEQYNAPPELSQGHVSPETGSGITLFTYSVRYYDADGDPPSFAFVYVDGAARQMWLAGGSEADGTYEYQTFLSVGEDHTYHFEFQDPYGKTARFPSAGEISGPLVLGGGQVPMLSDGVVSPRSPLVKTPVTYTVRYTSVHNYRPTTKWVVIDGSPHEMEFLEGRRADGSITYLPDDANFASGATYYFKTSDLSLGEHVFYFSFIDETGGAGRFPARGEIRGPNVVGTNTPPVLSEGKVEPASGTQTTEFKFSVRYFDINANPAQDAFVYVDDERYEMELLEGEAWDGVFSASITGLACGLHSYWFWFTDSLGAEARLPGAPGEQFEGPFVRKTNTPPVLSDGTVEPPKGSPKDTFRFSVKYQDDQGDAPRLIALWLDGQEYDMSLSSGIDYDGTYSYVASPGTLSAGEHHYYFFANDGYGGIARLPESGYFTGPNVQYGEEAAIPYWLVDTSLGFDTYLVMTNLGEDPVSVTVQLTRYNGVRIPGAPVPVRAGGTKVFKLSDVPGVEDSDYGTGYLSWKAGTLVVWSKIEAGASFPVELYAARQGPVYLPFWQVVRNGKVAFDTFISLANPSEESVDVTIELYDDFGALVETIDSLVNPLAMRTFMLSEYISSQGTTFGSARMLFGGELRVWAAMCNFASGGGYELPVFDRTAYSPYLFPAWMNSPYMAYDTYVVFANFADGPTSPQLMFYNDAGQIHGAAIPTIPAMGVGVVQASRFTSSGSGWAEARWTEDAKICPFAVEFNRATMSFYPVPPATSYHPPIYLPYWEYDPLGKETYIIVRNPGETSVAGSITLKNELGISVGEFQFEDLAGKSSLCVRAGEKQVTGRGCAVITSLAPQPLVVWGMVFDPSTSKGCLVKSQEARGLTPGH